MERAKRKVVPRPAEAVAYREPIEQFQRVLGAGAEVRIFQRDLLHQGDITADFLHIILDIPLQPRRETRGNVSMTPESAAVFQRYMQAKTASRNWDRWEDERQVVEALVRLGRGIDGPPTWLQSEAAEVVTYFKGSALAAGRVRHWFEGIDYSRFATFRPDFTVKVRDLRDAYDLDEKIYGEILARAKVALPQIDEILTDPVS